jgi:hypothetical protein
MNNNKYQYKVVSSCSSTKKKKHYLTSTITVDPEFEKKLEELMSCEVIYSELEYM